MNKLIWTFLMVAITFYFGHAQNMTDLDYEVSWGNSYKSPRSSEIIKILAPSKEGFYAIRMRSESLNTSDEGSQKIFVEQYEPDMNLKRSEEISLKFKGKKRNYIDVIKLNNKLYLLTAFTNKKQAKTYLFSQELSLKTFSPKNKLFKIGEVSNKSHYGRGSFDYHISKDSSKLLVFNEINDGKERSSYQITVYDQNFEELWSKSTRLPFGDKHFEIEKYKVSKQADVFMLGKLYTSRKSILSRKSNYEYVVLSILNNGSDELKYHFSLEDKFITDMSLALDDENNLICAGFYSERNEIGVKGSFFFHLNNNSEEVSNKRISPFDVQLIAQGMSKRKQKRALEDASDDGEHKYEMQNYTIDNLILRSDGGALMIAEQFYAYQQNDRDFAPYFGPASLNPIYSRNTMNTNINTYYYYNDILVVNIRPDGSVEWASRIPKLQESVNDGGYYSSYVQSVNRDKIHFIFNDNPKNLDPEENKIRGYNGRNSVVSIATVYKDGSVDRSPLFLNKTENIITRPKICHQAGSRELILYGESRRNFKFGLLHFK